METALKEPESQEVKPAGRMIACIDALNDVRMTTHELAQIWRLLFTCDDGDAGLAAEGIATRILEDAVEHLNKTMERQAEELGETYDSVELTF